MPGTPLFMRCSGHFLLNPLQNSGFYLILLGKRREKRVFSETVPKQYNKTFFAVNSLGKNGDKIIDSFVQI